MFTLEREEKLRSRLLRVLRQKADFLALYFDTYGYTPMERLHEYIRQCKGFGNVTLDDIEQAIKGDTRKQFEWDGGPLVRATYGFQTSRTFRGREQVPPAILYYATHPKLVPQIKALGLIPIASDVIQLAVDKGEFGTPHAQIAIIPVEAREAYDEGVRFFRANERHFFCELLPVRFLQFS